MLECAMLKTSNRGYFIGLMHQMTISESPVVKCPVHPISTIYTIASMLFCVLYFIFKSVFYLLKACIVCKGNMNLKHIANVIIISYELQKNRLKTNYIKLSSELLFFLAGINQCSKCGS